MGIAACLLACLLSLRAVSEKYLGDEQVAAVKDGPELSRRLELVGPGPTPGTNTAVVVLVLVGAVPEAP